MFGLWGKATKPPIEDDNPLVAEARAELATIRQWDLPTRTTFSVFLATHRREFVDTFGGPDAFARVSRIQQLSFFKSIYEHWLFFGDEIDRLRHSQAAPPQIWDAITQMYAARLLSYYLLSIIERKRPWSMNSPPRSINFLRLPAIRGVRLGRSRPRTMRRVPKHLAGKVAYQSKSLG